MINPDKIVLISGIPKKKRSRIHISRYVFSLPDPLAYGAEPTTSTTIKVAYITDQNINIKYRKNQALADVASIPKRSDHVFH